MALTDHNIPAPFIPPPSHVDFNNSGKFGEAMQVQVDHRDVEEFKQTVRDDTDEQKSDDRKRADKHHKALQKAQMHAQEKTEKAAEEEVASNEEATDMQEERTTGKRSPVLGEMKTETEADTEALSENPEATEKQEEGAAAKEHTQSPNRNMTGTGSMPGATAKASQGESQSASKAMGSEVQENAHAGQPQAATPRSASMPASNTALAKSGPDGAAENSEATQGGGKAENPAKSKGKDANTAPLFKAAKTGTAAPWISLSSKPNKTTAPKPGTAEAKEPAEGKAAAEEPGATAKSKMGAPSPSQAGLQEASVEGSLVAEADGKSLPGEATAMSESGTGAARATDDGKGASTSAAMTPDSKASAATTVTPSDGKAPAAAAAAMPSNSKGSTATANPADGSAPQMEEAAPAMAKASQAQEGNVQGTNAGSAHSNAATAQAQNAQAQGQGDSYDYTGAAAQEGSGSAKASQAPSQAASQTPQAATAAEGQAQSTPAAQSAPATQSAPAAQGGAGAGATQEPSEGKANQAANGNTQGTQAGTAGSNQTSAAAQGPAVPGHGEAYDYAGKSAQEGSAAAKASPGSQSAPQSGGATPQNGAVPENNPADRLAAKPGSAAAIPDPQTVSIAQAASNPGEPGDPRNPQALQNGLIQSAQTAQNPQNPILRTNDPSITVESENAEMRESAPAPGPSNAENGTNKNSEAKQIAAIGGTELGAQPQAQPSDSAGSELARDVMDMVGRLLVSANPWAPIQEIRLVLNSEVVPNTEIQMRMASGSVDVNIISDNNESLALLGRAGAGLAKTLENTTPGVVRVQLFNGNMESVRMDTGDYRSNVQDTQPMIQQPDIQAAPAVEAYDYRGQHHLQPLNQDTPKAVMPMAGAIVPTAGAPEPMKSPAERMAGSMEAPPQPVPATQAEVKTPAEILEIENRELEISAVPAKAVGGKPASATTSKTEHAKGIGSSDLSIQKPSQASDASSDDSDLIEDVSQLVGRMLVSADPWAPVQEIRLILNSDVVPGTEIQMRLENGRVDVSIISDNDKSLGILGKAGGELSTSLESSTTGLVRVQMFNGNGELIQLGPRGMSESAITGKDGTEETSGIFAMEEPQAAPIRESASPLPPAEDVMGMVGRLLETAEPWSPLQEIRVAMNANVFPDTEIQIRKEIAFVDLNIISSHNDSLEMLGLAAAGLVQPLETENRSPVRVRVTSSVEEELP